MKKSIGFSGFLLMIFAASVSTQAYAEKFEKNTGGTTPVFSDFPANLSNQSNRPDYSAQTVAGTFIESFRLPCALNQKLATAKFIIDIRRLSKGADPVNSDAVEFWEDGKTVFRAPLWTSADMVGAQKVLSFDLSELPSSASGVTAAAGSGLNLNGLRLLTDGDFSFSVSPNTSVLSARLDYECGCAIPVAGTAGAGAGAAVGGAFGLGIGPTVAIGAAAAIALGAALSSGNDGNGGAAGTTGTTGTSR